MKVNMYMLFVDQGSAHYFYRGPESKCFRLMDPVVSVATT